MSAKLFFSSTNEGNSACSARFLMLEQTDSPLATDVKGDMYSLIRLFAIIERLARQSFLS